VCADFLWRTIYVRTAILMWTSNASRAQIASLATNARQVISELTRTVSHAKTGSVLSA
jgi:hypothetical protein